MNGGREAFPKDRDINTPGQLVLAMLLSVLAHAILIAAALTFSSWTPQRKIIVPGYKVDLVTLSPSQPASLLPPGPPGPPGRPAEPEKPQPPEPAAPKEEPKPEPMVEPKVKAAPPPVKKAKAEPVAKEKPAEAPKKIVPKSEDQPKKEPEKIEKEEAPPSPKTQELPPIETAAIPPGPSGRGGQPYTGAPRPSGGAPGGGGGGGGGGGAVTDGVAFPHMWYLQIVERKANENWITHGIIIAGKRADPVVRFRILKNGRVEGLTLEKSSGNAALDESAISAIAKASPFPPLPGDYGSDHLTVHFTFTYEQRD